MIYKQRLEELSAQEDKKNELNLLWLGANYNFQTALKYYDNLNNKKKDTLDIIINNNYINNKEYADSILAIIYFDSCAVRLYSIDELIYMFDKDIKYEDDITNILKCKTYCNDYRMFIYNNIYNDKEGKYSNASLIEAAYKKHAHKIIHIILRHSTGHMQNKSGDSDKKKKNNSLAIDSFLNKMSIEELKNYLSSIINEINNEISTIINIDKNREEFINYLIKYRIKD